MAQSFAFASHLPNRPDLMCAGSQLMSSLFFSNRSFILAILTGAKTLIKNFETVNTSSPSFLQLMKLIGAKFEIQK